MPVDQVNDQWIEEIVCTLCGTEQEATVVVPLFRALPVREAVCKLCAHVITDSDWKTTVQAHAERLREEEDREELQQVDDLEREIGGLEREIDSLQSQVYELEDRKAELRRKFELKAEKFYDRDGRERIRIRDTPLEAAAVR